MNKPIASYAAWTEVQLVKAPEAVRRDEIKTGSAMLFVAVCMICLALWLKFCTRGAIDPIQDSDKDTISFIATLAAIFFAAFAVYYLIP